MENNKIMNQIQFQLICIQIAILKNNVDVSMEGLGWKESVSLIDLEDCRCIVGEFLFILSDHLTNTSLIIA